MVEVVGVTMEAELKAVMLEVEAMVEVTATEVEVEAKFNACVSFQSLLLFAVQFCRLYKKAKTTFCFKS